MITRIDERGGVETRHGFEGEGEREREFNVQLAR